MGIDSSLVLSVLVMLHVYLCVRFAVQASFRYARRYQFWMLLIVSLIPVAGYVYSIRKLKGKRLEEPG